MKNARTTAAEMKIKVGLNKNKSMFENERYNELLNCYVR